MTIADDLSPKERITVELATELADSGKLHPLIERLKNGDVGPESARDALRVLAELDLDLLIQITLDGLIATYLEDPEGCASIPTRCARRKTGVDQPDGSEPRNTPA